MKKTYLIYVEKSVEGWTALDIQFDSMEAAEEYCNLKGFRCDKYNIEEKVCYKNLKDYAENNKQEYKELLENKISSLEFAINQILNNQTEFWVDMYRGVHVTLAELMDVINHKEENYYKEITVRYRKFKLTKENYKDFCNTYKEIHKTIQNYKKQIQKCEKELLKLNSEENNVNEDEQTF